MDIYITDLESGEQMRIPMLPEEISVRAGAIFQSYVTLGMGAVKIPTGDELRSFSWRATLPGEARRNDPFVREWQDPLRIQQRWSWWRTRGTKLRLLVTNTPINHDVYLDRYTATYTGGYGDYAYDIVFDDARNLHVPLSKRTGGNSEEIVEDARPEPPMPRTHTIVRGDTLWGIAQSFYGDGRRHGEIYAANADAIEAEARRRGMRSSSNGHWIFPGTVLVIP